MKKIVSAFFAGALMMVSVQAFGDSISQIGKKIQTEYMVTVDGQQLTVPAIAVDGKSYAPVRAIGEAAGYDISVTGKSITLKTKENTPVSENNVVDVPEPTPEPTPAKSVNKQNEQELKERQVFVLQAKIDTLKGQMGLLLAQLDANKSDDNLKLQLSQKQNELKNAEAQLAELQK